MKLKSLIVVLLCIVVCSSCEQPPIEAYAVLPQPQEINYVQGFVKLKDKPMVVYSNELSNEALLLASYLKNDFAVEVTLEEGKDKGDVILLLDSTVLPDKKGGYVLEGAGSRITIKASTPEGVFNGVQTLRQIIKEREGRLTVQKALVTDYPAFSWRAFMLDEGRYFKGKEVVLNLLDRMAELKMNVFHWHLTDDQGWRIEIKKYPKLTEVGAFRDSSEINHFHSNVFDGKPHGGFYTQDDIKEVVDYAAKRHIMIVPEIEMPGHASAAIASYPWLGTTGKQIKVPCNFGVHYNAYNVADPRVIQFQEDVLEEVIALFPSPVIHIGGDELRYNAWKESPMVRNYMKQNKITSPGGLQVFFTNNISNFLASKNRHMMGSNEITGAQVNDYQRDGSGASQQQLAPGTIVHFWKGEPELIKETIEKGYDIVNSYHIYTYLDYDYESIPLQKSYEFNPIPEGLTEAQQSKVLGIGCQMWGEFIPTVESMNKKIYPRLAAYAEVGWTNPSNKDFDRFRNSLNSFIGHWEKLGIQLGEWK